MTTLQAVILGILQGITEFLPISSSGHLVIVEKLFGLDVELFKSFDVAVHFGTLISIIIYFWKDIIWLFKGFFSFFQKRANLTRELKDYRKWVVFILIGSIPAVIVGALFENQIDGFFRNAFRIGLVMVMVGIFFLFTEYIFKRIKVTELTLKSAIIIGISQAIALVPGISRSGSTISTGLLQGVNRETSARFSFLLGSPAIFGAALLTFIKLDNKSEILNLTTIIGLITSAVIGYASVSFLMKYLKKHGLYVFGLYLIAVGALISIFLP